MARHRGKPVGGAKKTKSSHSSSLSNANDGAINGKKGRRHRRRRDDAPDDDDEDDAKFRKALMDQGKVIREMSTDGNCLFRSISDQLYDDYGSKHLEIRNHICDYLVNTTRSGDVDCGQKGEFDDFLLLDDDDEDVSGVDGYVDGMREVRSWKIMFDRFVLFVRSLFLSRGA
jgi:hypothetical protein